MGKSDCGWCGPIVLMSRGSTRDALNQQVPDVSSDSMSPSIQPGMFCVISEFYITSAAKYEYKMENS